MLSAYFRAVLFADEAAVMHGSSPDLNHSSTLNLHREILVTTLDRYTCQEGRDGMEAALVIHTLSGTNSPYIR